MSDVLVKFASGPRAVTAGKLREMLDGGKIGPAARIASLDGGKTWITAGDALVLAPTMTGDVVPDDAAGPVTAPPVTTTANEADYSSGWQRSPVRLVAGALSSIENALTENFFTKGACGLVAWGNAALLIAAIAGLVLAIVNGAKNHQFSLFLGTALPAVALLLVQYIANRQFGIIERTVAQTRCILRSRAILDICALVAVLAALASLAAGIKFTVDDSVNWYKWLPIGLAGFLFFIHKATLAFRPALTTTRIDPSISAWKESVGTLGFIAKSAIRMVPVAFGLTLLVGTIVLLADSRTIFNDGLDGAGMSAIADGAARMLWLLVKVTAAPLAAYLVFVIYYHLLAMVESVFHIDRVQERRPQV